MVLELVLLSARWPIEAFGVLRAAGAGTKVLGVCGGCCRLCLRGGQQDVRTSDWLRILPASYFFSGFVLHAVCMPAYVEST